MVARGDTLLKRKLVQGVGINDAPFPTQRLAYIDEHGTKHEKWIHPIYVYWLNMLIRTDNQKYKEKYPAYKDVKVCEEWKKFTNFYSWASTQKYGKGLVLDKDILGEGRLYSPENCCFVPKRVNNFFVGERVISDSPKGLSFDHKSGKYVAGLAMLGKRKYLGKYSNKWEGHLIYTKAKLAYGVEIVKEFNLDDKIGFAIINKLQEKVNEAQILYDQNK